MIEEELEKHFIKDDWDITEEDKGESFNIIYQNEKGEKITVYSEGLFSNEMMKVVLRFIDTYGSIFYFEVTYKSYLRAQWEYEKFFVEKIDTISFWAMQNKIPIEVAKDAWCSVYPLFLDTLYNLQMKKFYDLMNDGDDSKNIEQQKQPPQKKDLF
jgi:hypothetical protein